jgi:hypothetical protein
MWFCFQTWDTWAVLSLHDSSTEGVRVVVEPPSLLSEHSKIEIMDVSKPQDFLSLRLHHFVLAKPTNLVLSLLLIPPISTHHGTNLVTQLLRKIEAAYSESGDRWSHCLD